MNLVTFFITLAVAVNGLLAGLNVDTALVKLPTRRRIGAVAYATFARGNDLGNGLVVYPLLGIGAALLTVLATLLAYTAALTGGGGAASFPGLGALAAAYVCHHQGGTGDTQSQRHTG